MPASVFIHCQRCMNDKSLSDQIAISDMPNLQMNENNRITIPHLNDGPWSWNILFVMKMSRKKRMNDKYECKVGISRLCSEEV